MDKFYSKRTKTPASFRLVLCAFAAFVLLVATTACAPNKAIIRETATTLRHHRDLCAKYFPKELAQAHTVELDAAIKNLESVAE